MIELVVDSNTNKVLGACMIGNTQPKLFKVAQLPLGRVLPSKTLMPQLAYTQLQKRSFYFNSWKGFVTLYCYASLPRLR